MSRLPKPLRGQVLALFALAVPALMAFAGLAIDGGFHFARHQHVRAAADIAAINGAYCLPSVQPRPAHCVTLDADAATSAVKMAEATAKANGYEDGVAGATVDVTTLTGPDRVRVEITEAHPTFFLRIVQISTWGTIGNATARALTAPSLPSILALDPNDCPSLSVAGNGSVRTNGEIRVNSNCPAANGGALHKYGNPASMSGNPINVNGGYVDEPPGDVDGFGCGHPTPAFPCPPNTGIPPLPDPLAGVPAPTMANFPGIGGIDPTGALNCGGGQILSRTAVSGNPAVDITAGGGCTSVTLQPGNYQVEDVNCQGGTMNLQPGVYQSIIAQGSCVMNFAPGVYVLKGGTGGAALRTAGATASLNGTGVTFYSTRSTFPETTGGSFGRIELEGNGAVNITAPTTGSYSGLVFFNDRLNTQTIRIAGNGAMAGIDGAIYGAGSRVEIEGNGVSDTRIIANTVAFAGNGNLQINSANQAANGTRGIELIE